MGIRKKDSCRQGSLFFFWFCVCSASQASCHEAKHDGYLPKTMWGLPNILVSGFPKLGVPNWVLIIRTRVYWGLHWGPLIWEITTYPKARPYVGTVPKTVLAFTKFLKDPHLTYSRMTVLSVLYHFSRKP